MSEDRMVQVSGFGVENTSSTQCNYLLVALTETGKVLLSTGDGIWSDVGPEQPEAAKGGEFVSSLHQCPCDKSCACAMDDPCLGCEQYAKWEKEHTEAAKEGSDG